MAAYSSSLALLSLKRIRHFDFRINRTKLGPKALLRALQTQRFPPPVALQKVTFRLLDRTDPKIRLRQSVLRGGSRARVGGGKSKTLMEHSGDMVHIALHESVVWLPETALQELQDYVMRWMQGGSLLDYIQHNGVGAQGFRAHGGKFLFCLE